MKDITRYRADDYAERLTFKSGQQPIDIDGWTFLMTVNRRENPVDASDQIFQSVGEIVAPTENGQADFPIAGTTDPGEYFFDIEIHDALGKRKTPKKGNYIVLQDITKGNPGQLWVPDGAVDADLSRDGSEFWYGQDVDSPVSLSIKYAERDLRRVVRISGSSGNHTYLYPAGPESDRPHGFGAPGIFEFTSHLYCTGPTDPDFVFELWGPVQQSHCYVAFTNGDLDAQMYTSGPDNAIDNKYNYIAAGVTSPGWIYLKGQFDFDSNIVRAKIWDEGGAEPTWGVEAVGDVSGLKIIPSQIGLKILRRSSGEVLDLASWRWEKVG